jgi:hypothetical protein
MNAVDRLPFAQKVANHMPVDAHSTQLLAVALLAFFGMLAAVWFSTKTAKALGVSTGVAGWVSLSIVLVSFIDLASSWGLNYTVPYDVPALAFFCAGIWCVVTNRLLFFYLVFMVATLNRETSCFLILFYIVWNYCQLRGIAHARRTIALNAAVLSVLWVAIKIVPTHMFHGHSFAVSGVSPVEHIFVHNLRTLLKPQQWPVLASICGFTLFLIWIGRRWIGNQALEYAVGITLAVWFLGSVLEGQILEIRIFNEWAAMTTPCLALIVYRRMWAAAEPSSSVKA